MANSNPKVTPGSSGAPGASGPNNAQKSDNKPQPKPPNATQASSSTASATTDSEKVGALYDTSYLNTSAPKNYPLIDQPGGRYKPLSDTSRFVFDKSDALGFDANNLTDLLSPKEDPAFDGKNASSLFTNRKYFGANKAIVDKLEDVQFAKNYTKPDYIAYLIPYGSPGLSSPNSQTVQTQVPGTQGSEAKGVATPETNAQKIRKKYPTGYDLFFGANVVIGYQQLSSTDKNNPIKIDEIKKQVEKAWYDQVNALPSNSENLNVNSILDNIKQVYLRPNYLQYESLLTQLGLKTTATASFDIQKLKQLLESITASGNNKVEPFVPTPNEVANNSNILPAPPVVRSLQVIDSPPPGTNKPTSITAIKADPVASTNKKVDPGTTGVDPSLKVWQFLYNPQSISIDVKADYAESNTWGATDDGQTGRSVQWLKNQNPVMRLDEVVLNGFIHNKKVGQLEEGLFALLMSRDGPGQIQPTVWEFVWGKRRFGPCIINNIQVVEKQWEAGEVLSATVSFDLTQIPKWQIIDSTVKFYDPTALGSLDEPGNAGGGAGVSGSETPGGITPATSSANRPGGGGSDDPCRSEFENVLKTAGFQKAVANFLLNCSKVTGVNLYNVTGGNIESKINTLLLQRKCQKIDNKPSWGVTNEQINSYAEQGKLVLQTALEAKRNCVNRINSSKEQRFNISSEVYNNLLSDIKGTDSKPGINYIIGNNIFGFGGTGNENTSKIYTTLFNRISSRINAGQSDVLINNINTIRNLFYRKVNFTGNNGGISKCSPLTIQRPSQQNINRLKEEAAECGVYLYAEVVTNMARNKVRISDGNKTFSPASGVFEVSVTTNALGIPTSIRIFLSSRFYLTFNRLEANLKIDSNGNVS